MTFFNKKQWLVLVVKTKVYKKRPAFSTSFSVVVRIKFGKALLSIYRIAIEDGDEAGTVLSLVSGCHDAGADRCAHRRVCGLQQQVSCSKPIAPPLSP